MSNFWQAVLSYAVITVLIGFFIWALCRVIDRNCDSHDFGYSPHDFNRQAKHRAGKKFSDVIQQAARAFGVRLLQLFDFFKRSASEDVTGAGPLRKANRDLKTRKHLKTFKFWNL